MMNNVQDINVLELPTVSLDACGTRLMPNTCGVYLVLKDDNEILYIGQGNNLRARWEGGHHHRLARFKGMGATKVAYILLSDHLDETEALLIKVFQPVLNTRHPLSGKCKLSVDVPVSLKRKLIIEAKQKQTPLTHIVRNALEEYLMRNSSS